MGRFFEPIKNVRPIKSEDPPVNLECDLRTYLKLSCSELNAPKAKENGGELETWHWPEEYKQRILAEMGEFPIEDFEILQHENAELDKLLFKNLETT